MSLLLSIGLMWSYGSTKRTKLTLSLCRKNADLVGLDIEVSILLFKSLGIDPYLLIITE